MATDPMSRKAEPDSDLDTDAGGDLALEQVLKGVAEAPEYSIGETERLEERTAGPMAEAQDVAPRPAVPRAVPRLEDYELLEEIGRGGMGAVYRARQKATGRLVAVKVILGRRGAHPDVLRRFEREIHILGRLRHPRIADIYTAGTTLDGDPFFAMELVDGVTLDQHQAAQPALRERLELFRKVCDAVAHSHRLGVIHRDLKPQNVMVCGGGTEVKVLDFGLARLDESDAETLTRQGLVQGTLPYMSPEQIRGEPVTTLSDVYALGVMLYELVTGRRPYELSTQNLLEAARVICEAPVRPPSLASPSHPRKKDLDAIVLKALEKEPSRRHESVAGLSGDIQNYMTHQPVLSSHIRLRLFRSAYNLGLFCRRNGAAVLVGAVAAVALVSLGLWSFRNVEAQRLVAERNAQESAGRLAALYEEQGRQESLAGRQLRASVYLSEAYLLEPERTSLRFLLGRSSKALESRAVSLAGHTGPVSFASFSPDGSRIATAGMDGTVKVWDTASHGLLASFEDSSLGARFREEGSRGHLGGESAGVVFAAFSQDGAQVLMPGGDETARVWDVASGKLLRSFGSGTVQGASVSPDGSMAVTVDADGAEIWDARDGKLLAVLDEESRLAAFSPDGGRLLTLRGRPAGTDRETCTVWDLEGIRSPGSVEGSPAIRRLAELEASPDVVREVAFSPAGTRMVTTGTAPHAQVWDTRSGKLLALLQGHSGKVSWAAFSADGTRIVTAGLDGTAKIWETTSGQFVASLEGHSAAVFMAHFHPDGSRVVTASADGTAKIWDSASGRLLDSLEGHSGEVAFAAFSPDGSLIVTAGAEGAVKLWPAKSSEPGAPVPVRVSRLSPLEFRPDGRRIFVTAEAGQAQVWDLDRGALHAALQRPDGTVLGAAFSSDGRRIVTSSEKVTQVWDAETGALLTTLNSRRWMEVAFTPDDRSVIAVNPYALAVLGLETGKASAPGRSPGPLLEFVRVSPDGSRLLTRTPGDEKARAWVTESSVILASHGADWDQVFRRAGRPLITETTGETSLKTLMSEPVRLVSTATGQSLSTLEDPRVLAAAFSPDGRRFVTVSADGKGTLRESEAGRLVASFETRYGSGFLLGFSRDGSRFLTARASGAVEIWDGAEATKLATLDHGPAGVLSAAFSPDGSRLATLGADGTLKIWDVHLETRSPQELARLVRCRAPWRIAGGRLAPAEPGPCLP